MHYIFAGLVVVCFMGLINEKFDRLENELKEIKKILIDCQKYKGDK